MRNKKIDNIKAILIFLVVIGHLYEVVSFPTSQFQYIVIYSFHMPAFIFLSGICFKKRKVTEILKKNLYPYVIFQTLALVISYAIIGEMANLKIQYTTPYWVLWYLFALMIWSMIANFIEFSKKSGLVILLISFCISILSGYFDFIGYYLSLSRIIAYFPFYFLGIYIKKYYFDFFEREESSKVKIIVSIILIIAITFLYSTRNYINPRWFYNSFSYKIGEYSFIWRIINFLISLVFIVFFITIIPNYQIPVVTDIGKNSIYIFLIHLFIMRFTPLSSFLQYLKFSYIVVPISAILLCIILSSKPVMFIMKPFVSWPIKDKVEKIKEKN